MGLKEWLEIAQKGGGVAFMALGLAFIVKILWPLFISQIDKKEALINRISEDAQKRAQEAQEHMVEMARDSHGRMLEMALAFGKSLAERDKLNTAQCEHAAAMMERMAKTQEKLSDRLQYLADRLPQR